MPYGMCQVNSTLHACTLQFTDSPEYSYPRINTGPVRVYITVDKERLVQQRNKEIAVMISALHITYIIY